MRHNSIGMCPSKLVWLLCTLVVRTTWAVACATVTVRAIGTGNSAETPMWPVNGSIGIQEVGFGCFIDTLPRVQGRTLPYSILALMEWWMDTAHTFHLLFDEMTITPVEFAAIISFRLEGDLWSSMPV
ncbi:hypothetical protein JCGZ_25298 [Jatropha curcas]|uniref:Aminotransferase-like plant mobile domain-containing protein n=1 Tax=Jatropha curcas TaxID=180498 RepID=A0A067JZ68_JATCU|nr:hypothetical protein JCGZ_25298 [Jatropha curcas]